MLFILCDFFDLVSIIRSLRWTMWSHGGLRGMGTGGGVSQCSHTLDLHCKESR